MIARRLIIEGRVQGVGFRYSLREEALRNSLTGWTRNLRDGTVEALLQGSATDVERVIEWTHRGPPGAEVTKVNVVEETTGDYVSFETRPTA